MTQLKDGGRQPSDRDERSLSASTVIARWQGNGWDEPCKSRGLRTVLWAAGGEIPPADPAQLMLLDVVPDLADDLAARQGRGPDHGSQLLRRLQGLLKRVGLLASGACRFGLAAFFRRCRDGFGGLGFFWGFSFFSGFGFFRCLGRHGYLPNCWFLVSADHDPPIIR